MDNILEICNWLIKHPHILQLANQMFAASSLPLAQVNSFNESSSSDIFTSANSTDKV
jgi:hypothetical protein